MYQIRIHLVCTALLSLAVTACGGGSSSSASTSNAAPVQPLSSDNVLISNSLVADGVFATINQAGILRAFGTGSGAAVQIAAGSTPLASNGTALTGNGWLASGAAFEAGSETVSGNTDGKTYTISAKSADAQASSANMALATNLVTPTLSTLAGQYGRVSSWAIEIDGSTLTGTYGNTCTWTASLSPQNKTIDVTNITFQTADQTLNPSGTACSYVGKTFSGTAFLEGPSDANPNGAFDILFDDGGTSTAPTTVQMFSFNKQ